MDSKPHGSESPTAADIAKQAPHQATQLQDNTALADPVDQPWYLDQPTDLATMSFNPVDQPWYMDTGASSHMTNNTEMDPNPHGSESPAAADLKKQEVEASKRSGDQPLVSPNANMTKCHLQCYDFFAAKKSIPLDVLISYWLMAGFLGPVGSVEEAFQKGQDMLDDLTQEGIMRIVYEEDMDRHMIEFVKFGERGLPLCKHQGLCAPESFGMAVTDLGITDSVILTDGMLKQRKFGPKPETLYGELPEKTSSHIVQFNPTIDSVKPLLEKWQSSLYWSSHIVQRYSNLSVLVLRGCGDLLSSTSFPFHILKSLTILEISGSTHLTTIPGNTICQLYKLRCLNLSHLLIKSLPTDFFSHFQLLTVLILRGCSNLRSLSLPNKNLVNLDLSYCTTLQEIECIRSARLRIVDLSHTALASIPSFDPNRIMYLFLRDSKLRDIDFLLNQLGCIEILDLSGAWEVRSTFVANPDNLKVLDLSRTQTEFVQLVNDFETHLPLRVLILRECTSLKELPTMKFLVHLEVLDVSGCDKLLELPEDLSLLEKLKDLNLSGCSGLGALAEGLFDQMSSLLKLDLSGTNVKVLPSFVNLTSLSKLSLRGLHLHSLDSIASLSSLVELDLKGLQIISPSCELRLDFLQSFDKLQTLNLSETSVAQLPDLSKLVSLKELLLADCLHLRVVPDLQTLTNLETLDLSLSLSLVQDESAPLKVIPISTPGGLRKLVLTNRSGLQNLFALTSVGSLEFLDLHGTDVTSIPRQYMEQIKCIHLPDRTVFSEVGQSKMGNLEETTDWDDNLLRRVSNPSEIHIVSVVTSMRNQTCEYINAWEHPGFQRLREEGRYVDYCMSEMQERVRSSMMSGTTVGVAQTLQLERLRSDVRRIMKKCATRNLSLSIYSLNKEEVGELLEELVDATTHLSAADFLEDSTYLTKLIRIVIKLKLLIAPHPEEASQVTKKKEKKEKKPWFKKSKENDIITVKDSSSHEFQHLLSSYDSLTIWQQYCLLCFSAFLLDKDENEEGLKSLMVKKRMLIYLWVGEGFLEDYSSADMSSEEAGKAVLRVLEDKGFTEPAEKEKGRETGSCCMLPFVHEFVTVKAKEEGFFDFDPKNGELTPHFTRSQRACLLETQANSSSSCRQWADYDYYLENNESFKNVRTLFNVNEPVVHIRPEWFSKMKHLRVLHLGSWRSNHENPIEVYDLNFLEELKRMKTMRLISLHGLARVIKLPDSVCMLTNLIILDLRECTDLEELPADIGSLKSLTHLDATGCIYLLEFPKGIRLLSKLEVLKGFVITLQTRDSENKKACKLQHLLNLNKLRKLNIVVRINAFPDDQELQVLKDMDSLSKLKITWEKDFNFTDKEWFSLPEAKNESDTEEAITSRHKGMLTSSKWKKKLKCWSRSQEDREETSRNRHMGNIEKLELWCYPFETAPHWLNPGELKILKKLYICGGDLSKLPCGTNQDKWNVTNLRLKYLRNLEMRWRDLKSMFPDLTYLEKCRCPKIFFLGCDYEGVWMKEREEK